MDKNWGRLYYNRINSRFKKSLDACLDRVFKVDRRLLAQMIPEDKNVRYIFGKRYLPFHTHDKKWLAQYIQKTYYEVQREENLRRNFSGEPQMPIKQINLADIERYMENSYKFIYECNKYEQEVTNALAEIKARTSQEINPIEFRDSILKVTDYLGFNPKNASNGLEIKPVNWREKVIHNGFEKYITSHKFAWYTNSPVKTLTLEERNYLKMHYANESKELFNLEFMARNEYKRYVENRYYDYSSSAKNSANRNLAYEHLAEISNPRPQTFPMINDKELKLTPYQVAVWNKKVENICKKYVEELDSWRELLRHKEIEKGTFEYHQYVG